MAGRRGPTVKDPRIHVQNVRHWLKEIDFEGLIGECCCLRTAWSAGVALHHRVWLGRRPLPNGMLTRFPFRIAVVEICSTAFGQCTVLEPTMKQIMLSYDDAESKIKWLVVRPLLE